MKTIGGPTGLALRKVGLRYPEAKEEIACKGTAVECSAYRAKKKSFLFVGAAEVRVKLRESIGKATQLAAKEPNRFKVGSLGWVTVKFSADQPAPLKLLETWIGESYRTTVGDAPPATKKKVKKRPAR